MSLVTILTNLKLAKRQCAKLKAENEEKDKKIQQLMTILKEEHHSVFDLVAKPLFRCNSNGLLSND